MDNRETKYNPHPPACTCANCVQARLGRIKKRGSFAPVKIVTPTQNNNNANNESGDIKTNRRTSNWKRAFLLTIIICVVGLVISVYVDSFIPFWIMLGLSAVFSIEKWFGYYTRKHKGVGKLYRLILNLSILSLLGLLLWSGSRLFSGHFIYSQLVGSIIFLAEFTFFIWMWRVISKNSWRWPSMKLTIFSLILVSVVFVFAGVEPAVAYKDRLVSFVSPFSDYVTKQLAATVVNTPPSAGTPLPNPSPIPSSTPPAAAVKPPEANPTNTTQPGVSINQPPSSQNVQNDLMIQYLLDLINIDRSGKNLPPVTLGNNSAAQKQADDMLNNFYLAHWDTDGLKPYMRYTMSGGQNYMAENCAYTGWFDKSLAASRYAILDTKQAIKDAEYSMMYDDALSNWGHRDNILNPWHKKVNIGIAYDAHRIAIVQDFEGDYVSFTVVPTLSGNTLTMAGSLSLGKLDSVALYYDPLPQPMTQNQLNNGPSSYSLGKEAGYVIPAPYFMDTVPYVNATRWDVNPNGTFSINANVGSLINGRQGVYTVVIWADIKGESIDITNYSIFVR